MSRFHDSLREILEDIHYFLNITLNKELLSTNGITGKEVLLQKLQSIKEMYPALHLDFSGSRILDMETSSSPPFLLGPPPPYEDMNGAPGKKEVPEKRYQHCPQEELYTTQMSHLNLSGDGEVVVKPVPATYRFDKCGFLGKRGKERFGGLIKPSQQRFYGVKDGVMYYYDKPTDKAQRGAIALRGYEVGDLPKKERKGSYVFEIVCPGKRTYQFATTTDDDMYQWIQAINVHSRDTCDPTAKPATDTRTKEHPPESSRNEPEDIYEMVDEKDESQVCSQEPRYGRDSPMVRVEERSRIPDSDSLSSDFDYQNMYVGLWDCQSDDSSELDFCRGDVIRVLSKEHDSYAWWVGELRGKVGFVPKSYLMEAYQIF